MSVFKNDVTTLHIWTCSAERCGNKVPEIYVTPSYCVLSPRYETRRPCLPETWQVVDGRPYCPRHVVRVVVDQPIA